MDEDDAESMILSHSMPLTAAGRLRAMLEDENRIVVAPGVYDGLTARLALAAGFECLYMTGAGTSMSRVGMADLGIATFNDMLANAEMIANLDPSIPVIADADTGYGGPIMVARTATAYARAGVAAMHIEDQVQEKRCGQLLGKQLVSRDIWYARLRAAATARDAKGSDMLIIARTDARAGEGGFWEAVTRLKGAANLGGVDALFLESLTSKDEAREACEMLAHTGLPMLLNMVPGAVTPAITAGEALELGFKIMIFPTVCLQSVMDSVRPALKTLKDTGFVNEAVGGHQGVREMFQVCGLDELIEIDKRAGGKAFDQV